MEKKEEKKEEVLSLHSACLHANLEKVKEFIKNKADLNEKKTAQGDEYTPLQLAIVSNNEDKAAKLAIVTLLIESGAKLDILNKSGFSLLHYAVLGQAKNDPGLIKLLKEKGVKLDHLSGQKETPAQYAVKKGFKHLIGQLITDPAFENLYSKIQQMEDYGNSLKPVDVKLNPEDKEVKEKVLKEEDAKEKETKEKEVKVDATTNKGDVAIELAKSLRVMLDDFVCKSVTNKPSDEEIKSFTEGFVKLLHSKDDVMKKHRAAWKPIVANILLAFTGIGLIALAIKAGVAIIKKKDLLNEGLFFGKTKSQQKAGAVEDAVHSISPAKK